MSIERGELWWLDWSPGRGSEQAGRRPALVVQSHGGNRNRNYPLTIVVAVSRKGLPILQHVQLLPTPENGLKSMSFVKTEQIQTVSKERLQGRIGRVDPVTLAAVDAALLTALGLPG